MRARRRFHSVYFIEDKKTLPVPFLSLHHFLIFCPRLCFRAKLERDLGGRQSAKLLRGRLLARQDPISCQALQRGTQGARARPQVPSEPREATSRWPRVDRLLFGVGSTLLLCNVRGLAHSLRDFTEAIETELLPQRWPSAYSTLYNVNIQLT